MLVALYAIFFLGGGFSLGISDFIDELEDSTKIVVVDDERQKAALGTIKEMKNRIKEHKKNVTEISKALGKEISEHSVRSNEIDKLWDQYIDLSSDVTRDVIELRFQFRDQLTRDEWDQVFVE